MKLYIRIAFVVLTLFLGYLFYVLSEAVYLSHPIDFREKRAHLQPVDFFHSYS
jgi:hypothetical protein